MTQAATAWALRRFQQLRQRDGLTRGEAWSSIYREARHLYANSPGSWRAIHDALHPEVPMMREIALRVDDDEEVGQ